MPPAPKPPMTFGSTVLAVCVGGLLAYIVILLAANASPDDFYFPIKVVVDDLPNSFR